MSLGFHETFSSNPVSFNIRRQIIEVHNDKNDITYGENTYKAVTMLTLMATVYNITKSIFVYTVVKRFKACTSKMECGAEEGFFGPCMESVPTQHREEYG